uniref:Uncharacterized protein n=1 Tax=Octopus bimaculoides TaxID=37653 RepID=A0A0L8HUM4_OCTBM
MFSSHPSCKTACEQSKFFFFLNYQKEKIYNTHIIYILLNVSTTCSYCATNSFPIHVYVHQVPDEHTHGKLLVARRIHEVETFSNNELALDGVLFVLTFTQLISIIYIHTYIYIYIYIYIYR